MEPNNPTSYFKIQGYAHFLEDRQYGILSPDIKYTSKTIFPDIFTAEQQKLITDHFYKVKFVPQEEMSTHIRERIKKTENHEGTYAVVPVEFDPMAKLPAKVLKVETRRENYQRNCEEKRLKEIAQPDASSSTCIIC